MKIKLTLAGLILLPALLKAQVNINVQLPLGGMVLKDQLWNLVVINNKEEMLTGTLRMSLQDKASSQVVLSANTGMLVMPKGIKVISIKDLQPIMYNYNNQDFSRNYLPMGSYTACYQLSLQGDKSTPLAEECVQINIEPISPPLLSTPADNTDVPTVYPQFSWMPPAPFDMFANLNYDLIVAEVLEGQTPLQALQYNTPILAAFNLIRNNSNYSTSFTALTKGKKYAWQVTARNGNSYAAKTEIWTFTVANEKTSPVELTTSNYILVENELTDIYTIKGNNLLLKYVNDRLAFDTDIQIKNDKENLVTSFKRTIQPGDNYLKLDLNYRIKKKKVYTIEIRDLNGNKKSIRFILQ